MARFPLLTPRQSLLMTKPSLQTELLIKHLISLFKEIVNKSARIISKAFSMKGEDQDEQIENYSGDRREQGPLMSIVREIRRGRASRNKENKRTRMLGNENI